MKVKCHQRSALLTFKQSSSYRVRVDVLLTPIFLFILKSQSLDLSGLLNVVPNSNPSGIKRFVPVFPYHINVNTCYIIMRIQ